MFYISEYERYTTYHPAEGGIYISGLSHVDSAEYNSTKVAFLALMRIFKEALANLGITAENVVKNENGIITYKKDEYFVVCDYSGFKTGVLYEHEGEYDESDGEPLEECKAYVSIYKDARYVDEIERTVYMVESEKGIHEKPAIYC